MRHFRVFLVLLSLLALALTGCVRELPIELVKLEEVLPRAVERGDHLEIRGSGFPQGRTAKVTLRGELHRPGSPAEPAAIVAEGTVTSPERIDVMLDDRFEAVFCGTGADADHTTFAGEVQIAFAARSASAPPVGATLPNVRLDMHPVTLDAQRRESQLAAGHKTLAFLGIESVESTPGGLVARTVTEGSRADSLGIGAGDVITSFGGLRTEDVRDLSASSIGPLVTVTFLRVSGRQESRELSVVGLSEAASPDLAVGLGILAAIVLLLCAFVLPLASPLSGFEATLASVRGRMRFFGGAELYAPPLVAMLAAILAIAPVALGSEVDVPLCVSIVFALMLLDAIERGAGKKAILRNMGAALVSEIAPMAALVAIGVAAGGGALLDAARTQGALPWHWLAFKSPIVLAAIAIVFAARLGRENSRTSAFATLALGVTAFVLVTAGLGGGADSRLDSSHAFSFAALVFVKTWLVSLALLAMPRIGAALSTRVRAWVSGKTLLASSVILLAAAIVCVRFDSLVWVRERTALALVCALVLVLLRAALRQIALTRSREAHVDPFI